MEAPENQDGRSHDGGMEMARQLEIAGAECNRLAKELVSCREERNGLLRRLEADESNNANLIANYKCERETLEQHVKNMAAVLEKRVEALQKQLQSRNLEVIELHEENAGLNRAFIEVKSILKESNAERELLSGKLLQQQQLTESIQKSLRIAEANEEMSKKELADAVVTLADAKAEVWAVREAAKGKALGEDERRELEGALKALSASIRRANEEASIWKDKAETQNQELSCQAVALANTQAEAAVFRQMVIDLEVRVEEASRLQAEAESVSRRLTEETERRARAFKDAVRNSVGKIKKELEAERDAALERVKLLESDTAAQINALQQVNERFSSDLSGANAKIPELEKERKEMKAEVTRLGEQLQSWQATAENLEKKRISSIEQAQAMTIKVEKIDARCQELQGFSDTTVRKAAVQESTLLAEISRLQQAVSELEEDKKSLQVVFTELQSKVREETASLRAQIVGLEEQLRYEKEHMHSFSCIEKQHRTLRLQSEGSTHVDFPLDSPMEERLRLREKMLDVSSIQGMQKVMLGSQNPTQGRDTKYLDYCGFRLPQLTQHSGGNSFRERISRRTFIMLVYIIILHIIVMILFTWRSQPGRIRVTDTVTKVQLPHF